MKLTAKLLAEISFKIANKMTETGEEMKYEVKPSNIISSNADHKAI